MKGFASLRSRTQIGQPPPPDDTFQTLERPIGERRRKTGRTEQFNVRVRSEFKARVESLAAREERTQGALLEAMLAAYEGSGGGLAAGAVPSVEAQAGRTRELRAWASRDVFDTIGRVAAERRMSISGLIEDLLAREVQRIDPGGAKFGVHVRK
jgi:predicted transcriptional regulator